MHARGTIQKRADTHHGQKRKFKGKGSYMSDNAMGHGFVPVNTAVAVVEGDLSCRRCNQNLNGLPIDGRCSQCGAPVGMTLNGELLRYADPAWVRKLQNGCITILIGVGAVFLVVALTIAAAIITRSEEISTRIGSIGNFVGAIIAACGVWMLTTPQPCPIGEDALATTRKVIRILVIIGLFTGAMSIATTIPNTPESLKSALHWITVGAGFLALIEQVAKLHYIEDLAMRIPDAPLSERADFLKFTMPAATALLLILSTISRLFITPPSTAKPSAPTPAAIGVGCLSGVFGIALLVLTILYIIMLVKLAIEFGRQAQLAKENAAPPLIAPPMT